MFGRNKKNARRTTVMQNPRRMLFLQIAVGVLLACLIALLITGIWYGTRIVSLTISEVVVVGGETIAHDVLETIAYEELDGTYYRLIPKRFAWTYPHDRIYERIMRLSRIKQVHVERVSGTKLAIAFEEYQPSALWCTKDDTEHCFFLDRTGYAFAEAPPLAGGAFLRFSEAGVEPEAGVDAFSSEFIMASVGFVETAYDRLGLNIIHVEKNAKDDVTYYVAGGGEIKTTLTQNTKDTLDNLEVILFSKEFEHLEPGNFKYIDLRYGNKVFVNETFEEPDVIATTSTSTSLEE